MKLIKEACCSISCEDKGMNSAKLWQLKKRLRGIVKEPSRAMLDQYVNLVTIRKAIDDQTIQMYQEILKTLTIKEGLKEHKVKREFFYD